MTMHGGKSQAGPGACSSKAGLQPGRGKKNKWALMAEEMKNKGYLRGVSGVVHEAGKDFREGLSIGDA